MNRRQFLISSGVAGLAAAVAFLPTGSAIAAKPEVFTGLVKGVAVGGYDPVAYFTQNKPVKGDSSITSEFKGATWRFASAENRDRFLANPAKYMPQFGGYCSWAVAEGYTAKGEPDVWKIVDGKLYLNFSRGVQRRWERDIPGNISRGNSNWPNVLN